jgi:hypothetical protein
MLRNTSTSSLGVLVSIIQVDIRARGAFLPPKHGFITTTSITKRDPADPTALILELQTREFRENTLHPTDEVEFKMETAVDMMNLQEPKVVRLPTSYVSPTLRISRSSSGDILLFVPDTDASAQFGLH